MEDFNNFPPLTKEQFLDALKYCSKLNEKDISVLEFIYSQNKFQVSIESLMDKFNLKHSSTANILMGNIAKKISLHNNLDLKQYRVLKKPNWFRAISTGIIYKGQFYWKLHPEFAQSIKEVLIEK